MRFYTNSHSIFDVRLNRILRPPQKIVNLKWIFFITCSFKILSSYFFCAKIKSNKFVFLEITEMTEIIKIMEIIGTRAFALSGALVAISSELDIFGVAF